MSELSVKSNNNVNLCVLVSDENPELKFILLDNEPLILGRTQYTGIIDQRMSKNQSKYNKILWLGTNSICRIYFFMY